MSDELAEMSDDGLAIASMDSDMLSEIIQSNLGNDDLSVSDLDRISMPSGGGSTWEVPSIEGVEHKDTIEGIIVDWQDTRAYWSQSFDEAPGEEPDCRSADAVVGVGDPGGECDSCPMSEWGSANGSDGQACKKNRLLFVVSENQILPTVIKLPPTSITNSKQYFMRLLNHRMDHADVVTEIGLETDENEAGIEYSKATFSVSRKLEDGEAEAVQAYRDQIAPDLQTRTGDIDDIEADDQAA